MNNCDFLLKNLDIYYKKDKKDVHVNNVSTILSEPNTPAILAALGIKIIVAANTAINTQLHHVGRIRLIGISGDEVILNLGREGEEVAADLPLIKPRKLYKGPMYNHLREVVNKLADIMNSRKPPLITDVFITHTRQLCKPKLGCIPRSHYTQLEHSINLNTLFPKIVYPTVLGWIGTRLRRPKNFSTPWLCVGGRHTYVNILCTSTLCTIHVSSHGLIEIVEGRALYSVGPKCSKTRLYIDYLLGNLYNDLDKVEVKKPVIWSLTSAIPVEVQGSIDKLELCIWNPYPVAKLHELVFEKHRVVSAYIYSVETGEWEPIEPRYNRINFGMRPLGLARLRLRLREIPPLLQKRVI